MYDYMSCHVFIITCMFLSCVPTISCVDNNHYANHIIFTSIHLIFIQDMKRGYCFVFMQEPKTIEEKNRLEAYVGEINGMYVSSSSSSSPYSSLSSSSIVCSTT